MKSQFKFANLPFERGEIFSQRAFSIYTDIHKLQDKDNTSYTLKSIYEITEYVKAFLNKKHSSYS